MSKEELILLFDEYLKDTGQMVQFKEWLEVNQYRSLTIGIKEA